MELSLDEIATLYLALHGYIQTVKSSGNHPLINFYEVDDAKKLQRRLREELHVRGYRI